MRKCTWNTTMCKSDGRQEQKTVTGLANDYFGVDKRGDVYVVTHLRTGAAIFSFSLQRDAKDFADRLSQAAVPVPWDSADKVRLSQNMDITYKIRDLVLGG